MKEKMYQDGDAFFSYEKMVSTLAKPAAEIVTMLLDDPTKMGILHSAVGISTEAGEILDAAKKYAIYGRSLDRENVIEELGDLEFYMTDLMTQLGITREEIRDANVAKLVTNPNARYKGMIYSDQAAIARADKKEYERPYVNRDSGEV